MRKLSIILCLSILLFITVSEAQIGIWTSESELADKPMAGLPWDELKAAADKADPNLVTVSDQDSDNNAEILAAAIVYARTGEESYKNKVIAACQKLLNGGKPADRTLAWARETGAYALAADLVGYRTTEFETWLYNMAEVYIAEDDRTLLYMFEKRPNNWGTQGFGSLCAIYAYLQDSTRLAEVRDYWIQSVLGPKPEQLTYGDDISWHVDPNNLRLINPKDAIKQGLNIDGIVPDDMRRGSSFKNPPDRTGYAWETLQGMVSGARILERMGMSIWDVADSAVYRAVYALQVRWENEFGGWKATGDDLWMLPFMDAVFGTKWTINQPDRVWRHGKNVGWPYIVWDGILYTLTTAISGSGIVSPTSGSYLKDWSVVIEALPAAGWRFMHWQGDLSGTENPTTVTMNSNKNIVAVFKEIPSYDINVDIEGYGGVYLEPEGGTYVKGTAVTLTAMPHLGSQFIEWIGDTTSSKTSIIIMVDSTIQLTAIFSQLPAGKVELRLHTYGPGSINVSPLIEDYIYDLGTQVMLTAIPSSDSEKFLWWSGMISSSENPFLITMDHHVELTAMFTDGEIVYGGTQSGKASAETDTISVATSAYLPAVENALYLAAISTSQIRTIISVEGLGLNWIPVESQAGGQNMSYVSIWMAQGFAAADGPVIARLTGFGDDVENVVIAVSYYGGVYPVNPIGNLLRANPNGIDGDSYGGSKVSGFSYDFDTSVEKAAIYVVISHNNVNFSVSEDYEVLDSCSIYTMGDTVSMTMMQQNVEQVSTIRLYGTFSDPVDYSLLAIEIIPEIYSTGIVNDNRVTGLPVSCSLFQNYPNPFNPVTAIKYHLAEPEFVKLCIFDITGKQVAYLVNEHQQAGTYNAYWNAQDKGGQRLSSGVYLCRLSVGGTSKSIRIIYLQ